jgi:hypothetical protein
MFVYERFAKTKTLDSERVTKAIEATRFPPRSDCAQSGDDFEPCLVQAANLIGQLGDPSDRRVNDVIH